jgi:hypothetical protein
MGSIAKNERKKTTCPAGSAPADLIRDDMATKITTEVIFRLIAVRGLLECSNLGVFNCPASSGGVRV